MVNTRRLAGKNSRRHSLAQRTACTPAARPLRTHWRARCDVTECRRAFCSPASAGDSSAWQQGHAAHGSADDESLLNMCTACHGLGVVGDAPSCAGDVGAAASMPGGNRAEDGDRVEVDAARLRANLR